MHPLFRKIALSISITLKTLRIAQMHNALHGLWAIAELPLSHSLLLNSNAFGAVFAVNSADD